MRSVSRLWFCKTFRISNTWLGSGNNWVSFSNNWLVTVWLRTGKFLLNLGFLLAAGSKFTTNVSSSPNSGISPLYGQCEEKRNHKNLLFLDESIQYVLPCEFLKWTQKKTLFFLKLISEVKIFKTSRSSWTFCFSKTNS